MRRVGTRFSFLESQKILYIWQRVWFVLFFLSIGSLAVFLGVDKVKNWTFWESFDLKLVALCFLFLIAFWDFVLFTIRALIPLERLSKYLAFHAKIRELNEVKRYCRLAVVFGLLNTIVTLMAALSAVGGKIPGLKDQGFYKLLDGNTQIIAWVSVIGALGLLTLLIKCRFERRWTSFAVTNWNKNIGFFLCRRSGVSRIWISNTTLALMVLSGALGLMLGLVFWKNDWVKWMKGDDGKLQINKCPGQVAVCLLFLLALLIFLNQMNYRLKDERIVRGRMMNRRHMTEKGTYELLRTRKHLKTIGWCNFVLMALWGLSVASLVLLMEGVMDNNANIKSIFKYVMVSSVGLMFLIFPLMALGAQRLTGRALNGCRDCSSLAVDLRGGVN